MWNSIVARITRTCERDPGLAHLLGKRKSPRCVACDGRALNRVEHKGNLHRVRRFELAAEHRRVLMAMPAAHGLFHKAIIQSGPGVEMMSREAATGTAGEVLAELGLGAVQVAELRGIPADHSRSRPRYPSYWKGEGPQPRIALAAKGLCLPLKGPVSVPDLLFLAAGSRRDFGVIAKDLLPAHAWDALAKVGRW